MKAPRDDQNPERIFMHDIATPVAVALGMIDLVIDDDFSGKSALSDTQKKRLDKALHSLLKLQGLMSERRQALLAT